MMTMNNEQAIKCLKSYSDEFDFSCSNCEYSSICGVDGKHSVVEYLLAAISRLQEYQATNLTPAQINKLVELSTPKRMVAKVDRNAYAKSVSGETWCRVHWYCPTCNSSITNLSSAYCTNCGQAITCDDVTHAIHEVEIVNDGSSTF